MQSRRAAGEDAHNVEGAYDADNQLTVSLSGADRRDDDEIRGIALQALIWDVEVPSGLRAGVGGHAAHARPLHAPWGRARKSWLRELMSSLANALRR
jgi:hypothetical protein